MKRLITLAAFAALQVGSINVKAAVDYTTFAGYSKPTGGDGGSETTVTSASALVSAAASSGKKIINISGSISNALVVCTNDKSFIGVGTDAKLTSSSFLIKNVSNIIIKNITMTLPYPITVSGSDNDGDVIHIEGADVSNVWIDHCELFNKYDGVGKDDYDGIIDIKKGSSKITVSWCYIHDAWKTSLIGYTESDVNDWQIAYHHNLFNYVNSRLPSIRGGTAALFNNYFLNVPSTAINCRVGATVYIEKNYFEGVGSGAKDSDLGMLEGPIGAYYSGSAGLWNVVDNIYVNCLGSQPTTSTTQYKPSFISSAASIIIPAADVPAVTKEYAGIIGKAKTLKYPTTKVADGSSKTQSIMTNATAAVNSSAYTIRGERVGKAVASSAAKGVYIIRDVMSAVRVTNAAR